MSWVYVGTTAVSVIGGAVSSNQAKKKAGQVEQMTPVDLQQEQRDALSGNIANQGSIEQLLARSNQFQQGQALSLAEQAMPGYTNLAKSLTGTATRLAENPYDVPKEVEDNLARIAAERGISAGTRGEFNDFSLMRDLGVNQLQYGRESLSQASQITNLLSSIAPKVNPMSPLSWYVTPQQNAAQTSENNQKQQAIAQSGANAKAAAANANNATWANLINGATGLAANYMASRPAQTGTGSGGAPDSSGINISGFAGY
jgi:hypothetical protein